jgi:hypothetical protein
MDSQGIEGFKKKKEKWYLYLFQIAHIPYNLNLTV